MLSCLLDRTVFDFGGFQGCPAVHALLGRPGLCMHCCRLLRLVRQISRGVRVDCSTEYVRGTRQSVTPVSFWQLLLTRARRCTLLLALQQFVHFYDRNRPLTVMYKLDSLKFICTLIKCIYNGQHKSNRRTCWRVGRAGSVRFV